VDTAPAVFANDWPPSHYQLPLVVVANSNNYGQKASDFQERLGDNRIFALGENVQCASADLPTGYRTVCGTSHCKRTKHGRRSTTIVANTCNLAAPLVTGIIAQLMPKMRRLTLTVDEM